MSVQNLEHKFLFVHIPKCGGSSIEALKWIGTKYNQHGSISLFNDLAKLSPELNIDNFFKFTFVRNPYTRFMSGMVGHVFAHIDNFTDLKDEITRFTKTQEINKWEVLREQHTYLTIDGKLRMDFIGRFERLQEDFDIICDRLGMEKGILPHEMRGRRTDYDRLYTGETRQIVRQYFAKDFELFGY